MNNVEGKEKENVQKIVLREGFLDTLTYCLVPDFSLPGTGVT